MEENSVVVVEDAEIRKPEYPDVSTKFELKGHGGVVVGTARVATSGVNEPLTFERSEPYVTPKIELSDRRQERVDVRVSPVIFHFQRAKELNVYPGQPVDVYVGER